MLHVQQQTHKEIPRLSGMRWKKLGNHMVRIPKIPFCCKNYITKNCVYFSTHFSPLFTCICCLRTQFWKRFRHYYLTSFPIGKLLPS